jgi:hypothetical protein
MRVLAVESVSGVPINAVLNRDSGRVMFYDARHTGDAPSGSRRQDLRTPEGHFIAEYSTGDYLIAPTTVLYGNDYDRKLTSESMDAVVKWLRCARTGKYSTARENGMAFIANRWTYAGDQGYRVVPDGTLWRVDSYAHTDLRPTSIGRLTEDDAHDAAWRLAYGK